ncbi:hypothetical protein IMCC14465_11700 [alpha proteobacterium IMCC14465]|uniref:Uncharacterized protein n=1 Tax=alpha proteobacterium IMCC14465 TaxID=1220535 RepID=J9E089_9PROT|nr:hypothetical protein IMCC14465_11700 [alpha proteobacterium IMCC14465]
MTEKYDGTPEWSDELLARRRKRAAVMGWVLAGFVVLFFLVTVVKLGSNIVQRPL